MTRNAFTSPWKGEVGRAAAGRGSRYSRTAAMTSRARGLRKDLTDAEKKLWHALRRDQVNGLNFRRQHPVGPYVLDFYCPVMQLAIELDGGQHGEEAGKDKDERRTRWLASNGITVVRFWNNDVLGNFDGVLTEIIRMTKRRPPSLTLPLSGGGKES